MCLLTKCTWWNIYCTIFDLMALIRRSDSMMISKVEIVMTKQIATKTKLSRNSFWTKLPESRALLVVKTFMNFSLCHFVWTQKLRNLSCDVTKKDQVFISIFCRPPPILMIACNCRLYVQPVVINHPIFEKLSLKKLKKTIQAKKWGRIWKNCLALTHEMSVDVK